MAEYYAVERSPEYLMHFGVKGMKWGIRKQIQNGGGRPHSAAYARAQQKLVRAASVGGAVGGIAGGLAKGFAGGAIGGAAGSIAGGLGYYATHRKQLSQTAPTRKDYTRVVNNKRSNSSARLSTKDKEFVKGMRKSANKGGLVGALTVGGGALGGAVGAAKYIKQHPKEYEAYKKKYKKMNFKERMRASYGRV